jgi:hypothetical protein
MQAPGDLEVRRARDHPNFARIRNGSVFSPLTGNGKKKKEWKKQKNGTKRNKKTEQVLLTFQMSCCSL